MLDNAENLLSITDPGEDRYASLRLIDWWRQEWISAARVMVVGAGALGNEVLKNLALLGVGHICIVDYDVVETSNLTRSVFFRAEDSGQAKSLVAARQIRSLNPDVKVIALRSDVTKEVGAGVFRRMDVVIGCLDNRAARVAVNSTCWNVNRPWVDGALNVLSGSIQIFLPPESACYECTMTEQDYRLLNLRYSCPPGFVVTLGQEPTIPMTASIIASLQVQEAVKLLHRLPVQPGDAVYYSGETMRFNHVQHERRKDCPAHHVYESITALPYGLHDLTLRQFMEVVSTHTPGEGVLYLPQSIVTIFYCTVCQEKEEVYRPYNLVVPDQIPCPHCGSERRFDVTSTFTTGSLPQDKHISLAQLGIPALHILPIYAQQNWYYFELSADEDQLFSAWLEK